MPMVRFFRNSGDPSSDAISDVEFQFAPQVGDVIRFGSERGGGQNYEVTGRVHAFDSEQADAPGYLAIAVKEVSPAAARMFARNRSQ